MSEIMTVAEYRNLVEKETDLQETCEEVLQINKILYIHLTTFIQRKCNDCGKILDLPIKGNRGWADLIIFLEGGRTVFVELKRKKKGREKPYQKELRKTLISFDFDCFIVKDFDQFCELLIGGFKKNDTKEKGATD